MADDLMQAGAEDGWPSVVLWGVVGAGLVVLGRRVKPGLLSWVANTAGYSLLTRAITRGVSMSLSS